MSGSTSLNSEHAFVPKDNAMTASFPSCESARRAISALLDAGVRPHEIEHVSSADHQGRTTESHVLKQDTPGIEGIDEILHVFTESFSDDDKVYVEFDRVLATGGAILSLAMTRSQERRSEVASLLRSHGASAIYYWGGLATERL